MTEQIQNDKENKSREFLLIVDRIFDTLDGFGTKVLSGRFLSTVAVVGTYCFIAAHIILSIPKEKVTSDFVFGFLAGFSSTVVLVLKSYFDRSDRKDEVTKDATIKSTKTMEVTS